MVAGAIARSGLGKAIAKREEPSRSPLRMVKPVIAVARAVRTSW